MEKEQLAQILAELVPGLEINSNKEILDVKAASNTWRELAGKLASDSRLQFDYLHNLYSVDWQTHFTVIAYLDSTILGHSLIVRTEVTDHENPCLDSVCDVWVTANFQEREIYDLLGITFTNHPDLRRLFLEDGWGFPLRKDYKDDINFIER
jgi:NADH:ubiquinone oxidoreductase subunit C